MRCFLWTMLWLSMSLNAVYFVETNCVGRHHVWALIYAVHDAVERFLR